MTKYLQRNCPACASDKHTPEVASNRKAENLPMAELQPFWRGLFKEKVFFTYDRCEECGLLYAPVFFDGRQLNDLYSEMAPNMDVVPGDAIEATQRSYFDEAIKQVDVVGGFLEIGPDIGYIVRRAAKEGRFDRMWLYEPNRAVHDQLADAAGDKPHQISVEMDDLSSVPDSSVALGVMIHVLDHLLDPLAILQRVRAKLKPGGVLMIVTHNEKSLLRKAMGVKFPPFCLQHPELYNPWSITTLVKRSGFDEVEVHRSKNYFPISFMVRQAAWTAGIDLSKLPLPDMPIGLRLGNMLTLAQVNR